MRKTAKDKRGMALKTTSLKTTVAAAAVIAAVWLAAPPAAYAQTGTVIGPTEEETRTTVSYTVELAKKGEIKVFGGGNIGELDLFRGIYVELSTVVHRPIGTILVSAMTYSSNWNIGVSAKNGGMFINENKDAVLENADGTTPLLKLSFEYLGGLDDDALVANTKSSIVSFNGSDVVWIAGTFSNKPYFTSKFLSAESDQFAIRGGINTFETAVAHNPSGDYTETLTFILSVGF
jgi:hypothetical protein